ncbi:MAG: hypothetical protein Q9212_006287, partial [Teloschistes hypoglaucus]
GFIPMKLLVKYSKSGNVLAMGLKTLATPSCPGILVFMPIFGHRPVEQRRE